MCVQYIGGCSVQWRDTMSTSGGYHEHIGGISWAHRGMFSTSGIPWVHQGIPWVHRGDIMSTLGDVQYIGVFNRDWKVFTNLLPHMHHDIPPMYWTSSNVLMISPNVLMVSPNVLNIPWCTHDIPHMHHDIPPMYWTLRCTHDIPPMYSWYPPMYSWYPLDVLNTPRCTEHPPMYWTHIIQGENKFSQIRHELTEIYQFQKWQVDFNFRNLADFRGIDFRNVHTLNNMPM